MPQITGFPRSTDTAALGSTAQIVISGVNPSSGLAAPFFLNSAANLSQITQPQGQVVAWPGQWSVFNAVGSSIATITKAAGGAGVRHVCTGLLVTALQSSTTPAATGLTVQLLDGASIIMSFYQGLSATASVDSRIEISGLAVFGSPNTAMTLKYTTSATGVFQAVNLIGYSVV